MIYEIAGALFFIVLILILILYYVIKRLGHLKERMRDLASRKQSLSTKYGKMTEQFMPFLKEYPYDANNFRFLGTPIDGVQFEDDKIVFIEFKTSNSQLTKKQRRVRDLIEQGLVKFRTVRI